MERKQLEILAPAGSYESMKAAVAAGADAVYIGGSRFGARAYAGNPGEDALLEAIDYVHLHGKRLYLTVNTLMKDREMEELYEYLLPYYRQGLDAVIVQDFGVLAFVKSHFPGLSVHASTQMTITGVWGAKKMKELGVERVVTARELSLEEIRRIHEEVEIEIESFVHGALCYCYSGQCLFSSLIGGRSGNRGRCAQPCRLPYDLKKDQKVVNQGDSKYVLSLKDLCALDLIPDLAEAGIDSLKIEGRMKSPRYTAGVTSVYRKYADRYLENGREGFRVEESDRKLLLDLFDRGGQTDGYYRRHNGRDMAVWKEKPAFRESNQLLFERLDREYVEKQVKEPVSGKVILEEGQPLSLSLECGRVKTAVAGARVERAVNQPAEEERIRRQIEKTGNTPFEFENLEVEIKGEIFVPVQALNELRREGLKTLEEKILEPFRRGEIRKETFFTKEPEEMNKFHSQAKASPIPITVSLERPETLPAALKAPKVSAVYIDAAGWEPDTWEQAVQECRREGKACLLALPYIFRTEAETYFDRNRDRLLDAGFDGVLIRSVEEARYLEEKGMKFCQIYDYNMYGMNGAAQRMLLKFGASRLTWPVELNSRELSKLPVKGELVAYGRLPMMVTAQCLHQAEGGCDKTCGVLMLKDRMGKEFPVKNHCRFCYNSIYNSTPLSLLGLEEEIKRLEPLSLRLSFTTESISETEAVIRCFEEGSGDGKAALFPFSEFTRGHFKRGVE